MKLKTILNYLLPLFAVAVLFNACVDPGETDTKPTVILVNGTDLVSTDVTLPAGSNFTVRVNAAPDATQLDLFTIYEDGVKLDLARTDLPANPVLLLDTDKDGFEVDVVITAASDGVHEYEFEVKDEDGNADSEFLTVTTEATAPTIDIMTSGVFNVGPDVLVTIPVMASKGSFDIEAIAVYQDGDLMTDLARLYYDDLAVNFDANPYLVPVDDQASLDRDVFIRAQNFSASVQYTIEIIDTEGNVASSDIIINTGTLADVIQGVLFNAAGPVGTGGLDLDEGIGTGSSSALAEIRDEGIDGSLPDNTNWKAQIAGVNGAIVKELVPGEGGLSEGFNFESISYKEEIETVYDAGIPFTLTNGSGDLVSNSVTPGELYVIKSGDNYYMILVKQVNTTAADNDDNYVVDIKK